MVSMAHPMSWKNAMDAMAETTGKSPAVQQREN